MKITPKQKKTFFNSFLIYSLAFIAIKMLLDRGIPETGLLNLILTGVGFGIIMGFVNIYLSKRRESDNNN
ncbi:MAG TPA: hypothetical protein VK021_09225 [Flavobacteriaceae bacterium]|nr:hypothetical protein [Flavobacteriaceae bacterium]